MNIVNNNSVARTREVPAQLMQSTFGDDLSSVARAIEVTIQQSFKQKMTAEFVEEADRLIVQFSKQTEGNPSWLFLYNNMTKVRWLCHLSTDEVTSGQCIIDTDNIGVDLYENATKRAYFGIATKDTSNSDTLSCKKLVGQESNKFCDDSKIYDDNRSNAYLKPIVFDTSIDMHTNSIYHHADEPSNMVITPYYSFRLHDLSVLVCQMDEVVSAYMYAQLKSISCRHNGKIKIVAKKREDDFQIADMTLVYRSEKKINSYSLTSNCRVSKGWDIITAEFNIRILDIYPYNWDIFVNVMKDGNSFRIGIRADKYIKYRLALTMSRINLSNGLIFFPVCTIKYNRLIFRCRLPIPYDGIGSRLKELTALLVYKLIKSKLRHRNIWLVYEKFCRLAEDNGYYFFRYCMENLSCEQNKDIYYIIDKKSPEYKNVLQYGRHVVDFMSFRYFLYVMLANLYVSSDSKLHMYQMKSRTNLIQPHIMKTDFLFLQHGVIAIKNITTFFKRDYLIKYFVVSSDQEKRILVDRFGYSEDEVPVVGLARWDSLQDRSNSKHPLILLMPTWRLWLEGMNKTKFCESNYFQNYSSLLINEKLKDVLERHNAILRFFIHPKFNDYIDTFHSDNPHIEIVPLGTEPLHNLIMECSMLVTDYSSVCWDVSYLGKPTVFYQFDQFDFLKYIGSYIDLNRDLPGPVCKTSSQVITAIDIVLENGCKINEQDKVKAARWFKWYDHNNCYRTYQFLKSCGY